RLLQEHRHSQTSLYIYEEDSYAPLARVDGAGEHQSVRYYHNDRKRAINPTYSKKGEPLRIRHFVISCA
uniref:hypothetical protein n=1 Tax=Pseudomonas sp. EA_15y_Pfl1_P104 TaxID=3088686 RepID=UPI0030DAE519